MRGLPPRTADEPLKPKARFERFRRISATLQGLAGPFRLGRAVERRLEAARSTTPCLTGRSPSYRAVPFCWSGGAVVEPLYLGFPNFVIQMPELMSLKKIRPLAGCAPQAHCTLGRKPPGSPVQRR